MEIERKFKAWYHAKMQELDCEVLILREKRTDKFKPLCYVVDVAVASVAQIVNRPVWISDIYWYVSFSPELVDKVIAELKTSKFGCWNVAVLDYDPKELLHNAITNR